jgi:hypothetical protein
VTVPSGVVAKDFDNRLRLLKVFSIVSLKLTGNLVTMGADRLAAWAVTSITPAAAARSIADTLIGKQLTS